MVDESQGLAARAVTRVGISRRLLFSMLGFGLVVAVLFPPFTTLALGVPLAVTYGIPFFPLCVLAGLTVGALNHLIFRRVVQDYLLDMHGRIAEFRKRIEQQAAGKAVECTPEECHLDVRSPDIFGDLAGSFNAFIDTTTDYLRTLRDTDRFLTGLEGKARLEEVADVVLDALERHFGAVGSILLVLERGELELALTSNVTATRQQLDHDQLLTTLLNGEIVVLRELPETHLRLSIGVGSLQPRHLALLPLTCQSQPVGLVVLLASQPFARDLTTIESRNFLGQAGPALQNAVLHRRLEQLAGLDELTGLLNRRFGLQRLDEEFERAKRFTSPLCVAMLDIDHFKQVNDTWGHICGDAVLRALAELLRAGTRASDFVMRYGGEEFMVAFSGASLEDAQLILERLRRQAETRVIRWSGHEIRFTFSAGLCDARSPDVDNPEAVVHGADKALYRAKEQGRNRIVIAR